MRTALRSLARAPLFAALVLTAVAAPLPATRPAHAQDAPSASETALAREQYNEGMAHARDGRWPAAYAAFSRAYALVRRPLVLLNLAGAEEQTGRLVESAVPYRQFLREVTSGREAQQRPVAEQGLARVEPRIPRARLILEGTRSSDTFLLDDKPLAAAVVGSPLPLDPGSHTLVVRAGEAEIGRITFVLAEREAQDVRLTVTRPAEPVAERTPLPEVRDPDTGPREVGVLPRNGEETPRRRREESGGLLASPVFWVVVGVVVIGGATAGVLVATSSEQAPFSGNLGSIPVR
jgi:hypothetical protein